MSGTNEHLSSSQLQRYRRRLMAPGELLAADDHLSQCNLCFEILDGAQGRADVARYLVDTLRASSAADIIEHPAAEELFDYADQRLDAASRLEMDAHLEGCSDCRREVIELQSIAIDLAAAPERGYGPRVDGPGNRRGPGNRQALSMQIGLRIAAAVVLAVIVAWVTALLYRSRIERLERENAKALEVNRELERQASSIEALQNEIAKLSLENDRLRQTESQAPELAVSLSEPGGTIEIGKDGAIRGLQSVDRPDQQAVVAAVHSGRVKASPDLAGLTGKAGQLMGGPQEPYGLVSPVATIVAEREPNLKWNAIDGAASYVASIYGDDFKLVAQSEALRVTEWTPTAPLERGQTYIWQVRASVASSETVLPPPGQPEARFRVLSKGKVVELNRAKSMYQGSHLMQGIIFARLGLLDDAERQLKALAKANPDSEAARRLLVSLTAMRRHQ